MITTILQLKIKFNTVEVTETFCGLSFKQEPLVHSVTTCTERSLY